MEKYRQFEDSQNGINPFTPKSVKSRNILLKLIYIFQFILGIFKTISFIMLSIVFLILQFLKHIFIFSIIKRPIEILINKLYGFFALILLGVWTFKNMNPKSTVKINSSFLIIATQSSIIDWLVLLYKYSPSFLWQVKSQKDDKDFWYELSYFQVLTYGLGLTFINFETCPINIRRKKFFMKDYFNNKNTTRPYVIFPEATKTNRSGVLKIASSAMKEVYELGKIVNKPNIAFKIEAFDYSYKYFQPNNTTDSAGLCMLFKTCCQFSNRLLVYSQDSSSLIFDKEMTKKKN